MIPVMLSTIEIPVSTPITKLSGGSGGKNRSTKIATARQIIPVGTKFSSFTIANLKPLRDMQLSLKDSLARIINCLD